MDKMMLVAFFVGFMAVVVSSGPLHEELRKKRETVGNDAVVIVDTPRNRQTPFFFNPFAARDGSDDDDSADSESPFAWARPSLTGFGATDFGRGFWGRVKDMMDNMQRELDDLYKRMNSEGSTEFGNLPPNYHNSTSTTKVVNGSVITVNETVDKHVDNNTSSFFSIKVVQVKPEKPVDGSVDTSQVAPEDPDSSVKPAETLPGKPEDTENNEANLNKGPAETLEKDPDREIKTDDMNEP